MVVLYHGHTYCHGNGGFFLADWQWLSVKKGGVELPGQLQTQRKTQGGSEKEEEEEEEE